MNQNQLYESWRDSVERFSQKRLTKPLDRFPALSGIVSRFQEMSLDTYFAGLWKNDLAFSFTWHSFVDNPRQPIYIAPYFSCASVDGQVTYSKLRTDPVHTGLSLLPSHCDVQGQNPTGALNSGFICISGLAYRATIAWETGLLSFTVYRLTFTAEQEVKSLF